MDNDNFDQNLQKTKEILAISEAFLVIEGEFNCIDIFDYISKQEFAKQIPIDNIADALEEFRKKGELQIVKETPPRRYRRIVEPIS